MIHRYLCAANLNKLVLSSMGRAARSGQAAGLQSSGQEDLHNEQAVQREQGACRVQTMVHGSCMLCCTVQHVQTIIVHKPSSRTHSQAQSADEQCNACFAAKAFESMSHASDCLIYFIPVPSDLLCQTGNLPTRDCLEC